MLSMVWIGYDPKNQVHLINQLRPRESQMKSRASVEDDFASIRI